MTEDDLQLLLQIQKGLVSNVPSSVRLIYVSLMNDQINLVAIFDRAPLDNERDALLDAGLEAADDFSRDIDVRVTCVVDDRPMVMIMPELKKKTLGYLVYGRYEEDY